jgi:integrase
MNELMLAYLNFANGYYVKDGRKTDEIDCIKSVIRVVREVYGHTPVNEFGPVALETVQKRMIQIDWSRKTINKQISRVRRIVRWGVSKQLIPPTALVALQSLEPLKRGRCAAREKAAIVSVPDEIVEKTIPFMRGPVAAMVRLQRLSGMRPCEVVSMRPCDIEFGEASWVYTPRSHKMEHLGRSRRIALGPRCQQILSPYLDRDAEAYLFSPAEAVAELRLSLTNERALRQGGSGGNRKPKALKPKRAARLHYDVDSYRRAIKRACKKAGVEEWAPNQLRHTAATDIRRRFGVESARTILGHSDIATSEIYAERDHEMASRIASEIG